MNTEKPLVSIIIRTKDRPKLLNRALQSIASQTYRQIEVVLVNDGGCSLETDELKRILGDLPLNYIKLDEHTGRARAGNIGIDHARGKYIGFLNDNDTFYPEHIAVLSNLLFNSDYKVVYADYEALYLSCDPETDTFEETPRGFPGASDFSPQVLLFEDYIPLSSILFDREIIRTSRGFDESLVMYEDWDFLIRISFLTFFYHVAASTSKCTQGIVDSGIPDADLEKAKNGYVLVLQKHSEKITPEAIFMYYTFREQHKDMQDRFIRGLEEELIRQRKYLDHKSASSMQPEGSDSRLFAAGQLDDLKKQLDEKNRYIEEIHQSLGWKMLMFYRQKIKSLLAPAGTKRQKLYNLAIASIPILKEKGFPFVFRKAKNVLKRMRAKKNITREQYHIPVIRDEMTDMIDTRVSVVIPTRDAGNDFRYTLERIVNQKGIKEIEVIIIDSGSEDGTLAIAEKYGSRIYSVNPYEFNHGATRNLGAEKASGDFLVFASQDAIPISDFCIFDIVKKMQQDERIAAATVKQVPRSDADLFSCWQLWFYNNRLLQYSEDTVATLDGEHLQSLSPADKRRLIQIDNVFSCFRREIFDRFKFNALPYAEDLDLGMRLIGGGYKILFMISASVIHSHNRGPEYFFKRGYIDTRTLLQLLKYDPIDWEDMGIVSIEQILAYIYSFYKRVNYSIEDLSFSAENNYSLDQLLSAIKTNIRGMQEWHIVHGDPGVDGLFARIGGKKDYQNSKKITVKDDILMNQYFIFLDSFFEYLFQSNIHAVSENMKKEFISALYKLFAWTCGSSIGNYMFFSDIRGNAYRNSYIETMLRS